MSLGYLAVALLIIAVNLLAFGLLYVFFKEEIEPRLKGYLWDHKGNHWVKDPEKKHGDTTGCYGGF